MGKEARYKKEVKEVEIYGTLGGGRGAISVARAAKSAFTNISIWNIVCHSLGQKKKKTHQKMFTWIR